MPYGRSGQSRRSRLQGHFRRLCHIVPLCRVCVSARARRRRFQKGSCLILRMNLVLLARLQFHPIRQQCCFQNHSLDERPEVIAGPVKSSRRPAPLMWAPRAKAVLPVTVINDAVSNAISLLRMTSSFVWQAFGRSLEFPLCCTPYVGRELLSLVWSMLPAESTVVTFSTLSRLRELSESGTRKLECRS